MTTDRKSEVKVDWPRPSDFRKSIRLEFTLYMSAVVIAMMLVTGYVVSDRYVNTVTRNVIDKMLTQARSYSGPAGKLIIGSSTPDALLLSNTCKQLASNNPDVFWAGISGRDDVFIAHTDIRQVLSGKTFSKLGSDQYDDLILSGEGIRITQDTIYISVPIVESGVEVGNLSVAASSEPVNDARKASVTLIAIITLAVMAIGIPMTVIVLHRKLRPFGLIIDSLKNADLDNIKIDIPIKSRNEFAYLAETLHTMGHKLNTAQKELIEKQRIAKELEIAREIQNSILPKSFPVFPNFSIGGTYKSALEVGGDYYDFINFDDDHLGILIADVSGKSLPGMLVMLMTRDIVRRVARSYRPPKEILSDVNSELHENIHKGMFVTMFLGMLSVKTGSMIYASAGHNPLLYFDSDTAKATYIKTKGFPLGMMPAAVFDSRLEEGEVILKEQDLLVQYTDGVNEALNIKDEEYGLERFAQYIETHHSLDPDDLVTGFIEDHQKFVGDAKQYDDITMLALKWSTRTYDSKCGEKRIIADVANG